MDTKILWHVHSIYGTCHGMTSSYDYAIYVCMKLYEECDQRKTFFATQIPGARLGKEPQPNS